jgi:iron complex transport system substrate-binding protein
LAAPPSEEGPNRRYAVSSQKEETMTRTLPALLVALGLAATACATSSSPETSTEASGGFPVTIEAANGPVTITERPAKIVSLSPTGTEVLFAIEAGDQVAAVDDQSNHPAAAPVTDLSGLEPNIEAIAALEADLVVIMFDVGGETVAALDALGIPTLVHPAAVDLDDAYTQIEQLGAATGHVAEAAGLVATMQGDIDGIVSGTDGAGDTYYHELGPDLYSATSATFAGALYAMLGLVNIADGADPDGFGYPQLSAEHIVSQNPDLVFLADTKCCGESAATVAARPGWDTMTAIQTGAIVELDDDIASRWGPRVVEFVAAIAAAIGARVGA